MNRVGSIDYKLIKRVSPSQFYTMTNCAYKLVLSEAFNRHSLLPLSANAYLGTVLHKILEEIVKNKISDEVTFNLRFDEEIRGMEETLTQSGHTILFPLQRNAKDYAIKKLLLKKLLRSHISNNKPPANRKFSSERWFETNDGTLGGRVDLVTEDDDEIEISDFKTGRITSDSLDESGEVFSTIKDEYQIQLKLYAYLYFSTAGKYPTKLTLIDLAQQRYNVEFTAEECVTLFEQAKTLLERINNNIKNSEFEDLAKPSTDNCKFCLFRPACKFHLDFIQVSDSLNDVTGILEDVASYLNGNVSIIIKSNQITRYITGFDQSKFEFFVSKKQQPITLYNLKREQPENVFSVKKTTLIYE